MNPVPDWLSLDDALARTLERCEPLGSETVPLEAALGRALAEEVRSPITHPPWDNSAMDGFAVRAEDVKGASRAAPVQLPLSGDVPAGTFPDAPLAAGTAVRVMTGAPVPEGATGVIRIERTDGGDGGHVCVFDASDASRNIRRAGEDLRPTELVLSAGSEITAACIGVLALVGRTEVRVGRRPRVGVLASGDELVGVDRFEEVLAGRKIVNSNSHALAAQLRGAGAEPVPLGIARDTRASALERLQAGADCDALVASAGVSVGTHDQMKAALEEAGVERVFWRVRMRPGSPITFGTLDGRPYWGLPGNPVSALVTCEVFVRPAVRRLAGHARLHRRRVVAEAAEAIEAPRDLTCLYRVKLEPRAGEPPLARLTGPQGSGILTSMVAADGLLIVPEGVSRLERGARVEVLPLNGR